MNQGSHWQQVYTEKAADEVSWYQAVPARSLEWIEAAAPDRSAAIIDVGAGASALADGLLERGYTRLAVLDLASSALAAVRARLAGRAELVEWYACDVLDFVSPHRFDLWHDRAVLHFLVDPEERRRYAEVVRDTVRPGGHVLIATFAPGGPTRCSGLGVVQLGIGEIGELLGGEFVCRREEQELHRTPGGVDQLFQYALYERRPAQ